MKNKDKHIDSKKDSSKQEDSAEKKGFPGYPHYPASQDIYNNEKEVDLNPDHLPQDKDSEDLMATRNRQDFDEDPTKKKNPDTGADEKETNNRNEV